MNKLTQSITVMFALVFFISATVTAQELVPATSEDEELFEQQLEQAEKNASKKFGSNQQAVTKKADAAKFKEFVTSEAKKLKDATVDTRTQHGQNVAAQKRKNLTQGQGGTSSGSQGNSSNSNKDGRISAPVFNNSGGAAGSPGKSGNRPKK
jgi:hypothetical protein